MNQRLIGFPLLGGHLSELAQEPWRETNGDQLLRHAAGRSADQTHALQLCVCSFRDVGKINGSRSLWTMAEEIMRAQDVPWAGARGCALARLSQ
jgi:hypothetical protein